MLTRMRATELREVQFLNATGATQRFGAGTSSGAVLLVMQRQRIMRVLTALFASRH